MKAGILFGAKDIRVGDVSDPVIGPDDVLLESHMAGICGTDLHIYRGEFEKRVSYPAIQGHEFGGIIVDAGANGSGFKAGDRVVIDPILSCHQCPACLTGHVNACQTLKLLGVDLDGGYGQFVSLPANRLFALPDSIPMKHAPMVEMYALGHHMLQRGRIQPGETVVILGAGKLGLSILDVLCHNSSPGITIITDLHSSRLETAKKLGADHLININEIDPVEKVLELTDGMGADCVVEAVGHYHLIGGQEAPLGQAIKMIRCGGRVVTAGLGEQLSPIHFKTLVLKEAQIIASRVTCGEFPRAIQMMSRGLLHPDLLITDVQPLGNIEKVFQQVDRENPETLKVVLDIKDV